MSFVSLMLKMLLKGGAKAEAALREATKDPMAEQRKLLFSILESNKNTELGKELHYEQIHSIEDYQRLIPLTDYDFYADRIERMMAGEKNVILSGDVVHFNLTSGTLGNPKKLPVCEDHVKIFSKYYAKYINYLASKEVGTEWTRGKGLTLTEGKYTVLPSGISCGSASSLSSARMSRTVPFLKTDSMAMMYTSPVEARIPEPNTPTRFLNALFALREKNVTYANVTFSSYLLELMRYIEDNWRFLVDIIRTGDIPSNLIESEEMRLTLKKKLKPSADRASELEAIFSQGFDQPIMKKLWPNLDFIFMVGGAGFRVYTQKLRSRYCGDQITLVYLGLSASEGMFSVPYECENTNSVFVPDSMFFEFLPLQEDGSVDYSDRCRTLDQLEVGRKYELVATTINGLVRYKMKDVVEITGMYNNTPTMQFSNRSGFAISMYGEKTSEQALQFMAEKTCAELGLDLYDYAVCPDDDETPGAYVLCLELRGFDPPRGDLDLIRSTAQKYLSEANPSIGKKMDTGVVQPLKLRILQEETFLLYRDMMTMKGRSAAQLKPIHVLDNEYLKRFFYKLSE